MFAQKYVETPEECLIEAADREAFEKLKSALISSYEVALESRTQSGRCARSHFRLGRGGMRAAQCQVKPLFELISKGST